jgi:biopolymer transport protein ExbB/TolQ
VVAYNYFLQRIREFAARMDDFSMELLNILDRNEDVR